MKFVLVAFAAVHAVLAVAQPIDAPAERARIARERTEIAERFKAEEKACYGRFGVTDCIDAAKARRRTTLADLRRQEVALNDEERKARTAERLRELEAKRERAEKPRDAAPPRQPHAPPEARLREPREPRTPSAPPQPRPREPRHAASAPRAPTVSPAEAADNRKRYELRLQEAEAHRERAQRRLAQRKKPAASDLPLPAR
ncbi:hypothetical protein [Ramlibacter sp.]|uniref:hypothetical protein n=1 Tax=Ramlibacter sp. TaxID=1917967 RepID=UPI003D13F5CD